MKIISCGRARKNEAYSRREFLGSKILVELCLVLRAFERVRAGCMIALVESVSRNSQPHKPSQFSVVTIFFT